MGRFTASKYKNAAAKKLKKEETAFGIRISELCQTDPIACGADKVVFTGETASLGVLDVGEIGNVQARSLRGHSEFVRSLEFNPFNKDCLCTCAGDGTVKLWNTDTMSCTETINVSEQIHMTRFHPIAENVVVAAEHDHLSLYDISTSKKFYNGSEKGAQSCTTVSWSYDGRLVCSTSRSGEVSIVDVRGRKAIATATLFDHNRDICHEWLGTEKLILGGFKNRERVYQTVDITNLSNIISALKFGAGSGMPHIKYDYDTRMLFLYSKGDHGFSYCEVGNEGVIKENWKEKCIDVIKGMALAPKTSLNVMAGEVNRLMILHHSSISPTPFIVPRRTYTEFHADLFPETRGPKPGIDGEGWWLGNDGYRELISLDPAATALTKLKSDVDVSSNGIEKVKEEIPIAPAPVIEENEKHKQVISHLMEGHSLMKNIEGLLSHRDLHYHGLKSVQTVIPQECNGFQIGKKYGAHLMVGSGGRLGIIDLASPGNNNTPQLEIINVGNPLVFQWDPFSQDHVIAVGGDCSTVKLWKINDMNSSTLLYELCGHTNKVVLMSYHPGVAGLLATCDSNGLLILWDSHKHKKLRTVDMGSGSGCIAMCWDPTDGYILYFVQKSGMVIALDCRTGSQKVIKLDEEIRNARTGATKDVLVVSTFGQGNSRSLYVLSLPRQDKEFLLRTKHKLGIGTSIFTPFLDIDLNLAFFVARGESAIIPFELSPEAPYVLALATYSGQDVQYACAQLNRDSCDVMAVEMTKLYKLCKDSVQLVTMFLPRIRKEYFQDDVYQMRTDFSSPILSVTEWSECSKGYQVKRVDLCPEGVKRISEVEVVKTSNQHSKIQQEHLKYKSHEAQRDELFNAFAEQVQMDAGPLEQDLMEGCEDDEWSD